jgi:hypothetical protein
MTVACESSTLTACRALVEHCAPPASAWVSIVPGLLFGLSVGVVFKILVLEPWWERRRLKRGPW